MTGLRYMFMKDIGSPILLSFDEFRRKRARKKNPSRRKPEAWAGPPLKSAVELKRIMTRHYFLSRYAAGHMPVAWVTSGAPVELLRPFGIYSVYPENHGAICGARKMGQSMCEEVEARGYHQDLCSYAKIDISHSFTGKTPIGILPKPDLLFISNNICQTVLLWFRVLAQRYGIPLLLFDTPYMHDSIDSSDEDYMVRQLESFIPALEEISGKSFNMSATIDVMAHARRASELWGKALDTMRSTPSPMTVFDAFVHLAPVVSLRGLRVAGNYYKILSDELALRTSESKGAVKPERFRLIWDNIAIWFLLRDYAKLFGRKGCTFVASTYTSAWADTARMIDPDKPLLSMARTYSGVILNRSLGYRLNLMRGMARDFNIDGIVFHSTRSCKPYSIGQLDLRRLLSDVDGIKGVLIDADMTDPRCYSTSQAETRIDAFIESLENTRIQ